MLAADSAALATAATRSRRRALVWGGLAVAVALAIPIAASARLAGRRSLHEAVPPAMQADPSGVTLSEGAPQWAYVTLAVAQEGPALLPLPVPARVVFDEKLTASIGAPLVGRIEQVVVRPGDTVKAGDHLFSMRSRDFAEMERDVATSREAVMAKRRLRDRTRELFELNIVPEKDLLAADSELKQAELSVKAAEAKRRSVAVAPAADNLFWMRAPRAGTVVSVDAFASQEVSPERAEPLLRISDMAEVIVVADLPDSDFSGLGVGAEAVIRTRDGQERPGRIQHIANVVDPLRQTVSVRIRAQNADGALKPNAFVEVSFRPQKAAPIVLVDEDAVVSDGDHSTVFVLNDLRRFEKREVQPGRRRDGLVELRSGLAAGTRYAAKGALLLLNQVVLAD